MYWDLHNPGPNNQQQLAAPTDYTYGNLPTTVIQSTGMDFDPIRKRFVLWGGGNYVYSLTEPTGTNGWVLAIDNIGVTNGPGGTGGSSLVNDFGATGILGKWHYSADLGVFVGLKDPYNGNIWVYKPANWTSPKGH